MPVGDTADYVKIRDDWLWRQSLATVRQDSEEKQLMYVRDLKGRREKILIGYHRIRLGTFNVNGKLPSQDLSTWLVGGLPSPSAHNNEREHPIPPFGEPSLPTLSGKSTPPSGKGEANPLRGFRASIHSVLLQKPNNKLPSNQRHQLLLQRQTCSS